MKSLRPLLAGLAAAASLGSLTAAPSFAEDLSSLRQPWLNAELIAWDRDIIKHHRLAQALGYDQVTDDRDKDYPGHSKPHPTHSAGMGFYLNDPHKKAQPPFGFELSERELKQAVRKYPNTFSWYPSLSRAIDEREIAAMKKADPDLFKKVKAGFEANKSWVAVNRPFPDNLAQLQQWGDGQQWEPGPDFQRQSVIDAHVKAIVDYAQSAENDKLDYHFTGVVIDVIALWDEFSWQSNRPLPGKPNTARSAVARPGVTYDYDTLQEGWYVFLGQLRDELEAAFPDRPIRFVWEPTPMVDAWVRPLAEADFPTLTPELREKIRGDALLDEKPGMNYLTDPLVQGDGGWAAHLLGTASGDLFTKNPHYPTQLTYLGEISSRGSYLLSYGTFDRSRRDIDEYDNQFKLIRALSAWQNMHETPIDARTWDTSQSIYHSPTAYGDLHALAGLHSKNGHVYAVLLDEDAAVHLADGVTVTGMRGANAFWEPDGSARDAEFVDGVIRPARGAEFPVSVIAEIDRPDGSPNIFTPAPGVSLSQDRATFALPNSKLLDPDFESDGEGWTTTGRARLEIVKRPVASGQYAARVTDRLQPWNSAWQDITGVLMNTRQGRYRATAQVRPAETSGQFALAITFIERGDRSDFTSENVTAQPGEWTTVTAELDLNWGDWIENGRLMIRRRGKDDQTEDYFVDNVTLEYLGR
ncbi:MAG: carbohydrate binding domain-containing protein [Planctomycetota bacterium]